ncbi:MAG TPA: hypothetical protein PKA64_01410, partial [Myxococcota bacterium]|nr:hypothetical protein [Myxococcota bacterium]
MSRRGALGFVLSVVPLGILAWRLAYVCDDAYIVGRYARHLAGGAGLSFNLDEPAPVEGYSDLLWVLGAAAIEAMGLRSPEVIVWASRAAAVGVLATLGWVLRRQVGVSVSAATAACVTLGALPPFAAWTGSGLETMAAALAMFGLSA